MSKIVENEANPRAKASNLRDASNEARTNVCEGERRRAPLTTASNTVLKQEERDRFIHWISPILEERFGETIRTASNKVAVPIVLENGEEAYIVINVAIPLGEREAKEREEKEKIAAKEKGKNARKKARELRKAKREEEKAKLAANR